MSIQSFEPSPSGAPLIQRGKVVGHISLGGSLLRMPIGQKVVLFEIHRYFGPHPVSKKTHDPLQRIPRGFWDAYERWDLGGNYVDGDMCVVPDWCKVCGGVGRESKAYGGKHFKFIGACKSCNGLRLNHSNMCEPCQ